MQDGYERSRAREWCAPFRALAVPVLAAAMAFASAAYPLPACAEDPRAIALIDQNGRTFRFADLRGRPAVVTFVATRCTDACPIANVAFQRLSRRLKDDRIAARLVTVTLDPNYDTPFVMAKLAQSLAAKPSQWAFASGEPASVRRLMYSFGVVADKGRNGVPDAHSTFVYVLDRHVRLQRTFLLSTGLDADVEQALRTLPEETRKR